MRYNSRFSCILAIAAVGLAGCVQNQPRPEPSVDPILLSIQKSAAQIAKDQRDLVITKHALTMTDVAGEARKAQYEALAAQTVPAGLEKLITVPQYVGYVDTLLTAIVRGLGKPWGFEIQGAVPVMVPTVKKTYNSTRAYDALVDIGYSIQGATVIVDDVNKRVILRYENN